MSATATETSPTAAGGITPQLSTDYLNRHSEALMLLEMVPLDREIVGDLKAWRALGYVEHFAISPLRCAGEAMAAYRALDRREAEGFEQLCAAMDRLVYTATALLDEMPTEEDPALIVDVASLSLRRLIARATAFINANGRGQAAYIDAGAVQADIDTLMAS
ncbi:hypothetical protein LJR090_001402 [Bosea sp. LjRoot90]|uniref:hypothetical protein n=1 Tax=Bosea sp. LjRoot90 TaxID=3342342 RepID=UPI003ECE9049